MGAPKCPEELGMIKTSSGCDCPEGQVINQKTNGHCCWEGQEWSDGEGCVGELSAEQERIKAQRLERRSGLYFIKIPSGSFNMGSNDGDPYEKPVHRVSVSAFELSESEVTVGQYRKCVSAGVCTNPDTGDDCNWGKSGREDHPINCVDWGQARTFARWAGGDLPTEAEWEYAAKAGTQTLRFWGDDPFDGCAYANTFDLSAEPVYPLAWEAAQCKDGYPDLSPVGAFGPNAFGLHDMIGNVWEWIEDCSSRSYIGRPKDATPWEWPGCQRRIQRGGSWITAPARSRSAYHGDGRPTDRSVFFGFRVVRELSE